MGLLSYNYQVQFTRPRSVGLPCGPAAAPRRRHGSELRGVLAGRGPRGAANCILRVLQCGCAPTGKCMSAVQACVLKLLECYVENASNISGYDRCFYFLPIYNETVFFLILHANVQCYGVGFIPDEDWFCAPCTATVSAVRRAAVAAATEKALQPPVACALCPARYITAHLCFNTCTS